MLHDYPDEPGYPALTSFSIGEWQKLFVEHAKFLKQLVHDKKLKQKFENQEATLRAIVYGDKHDRQKNFLKELKTLKQLQLATIKKVEKENLANLKHLRSLNPIYLALIKHMIKEQTYYERAHAGKLSLPYEVHFYATEMAEHTDLLGRTLDPLSPEIQKESAKVIELASHMMSVNSHFRRLRHDPRLIRVLISLFEKSNVGGAKILMKILDKNVHTLLTPEMILHEVREAQLACIRFLQLRNLLHLPKESETQLLHQIDDIHSLLSTFAEFT